MGKLVATFAATTVLFAGSTFYFWHKLEERESAESVARAVSAPDALVPAAPAELAAAHPPAGSRPLATAASAGPSPTAAAVAAGKTPGRDDPSREMMLPFAKDFLRQYDDPSQRATLIKATRGGIESQYSRLKERLKLDAIAFGQLVDLLTEEQLEQQANYFRCMINPACDSSQVSPTRDHSDEYLAMLGTGNYAQFQAYRSAMPEWQAVVQLRGRLPEANYLNDGDADRLMSVLSAERERYMTESNQAGANTRGWGNGSGMIWYSGDGGIDEQLASATQYEERMRQRAATVLTAEQLRAFGQLQEEMLAGLAAYLRTQSGKPR